MTETPLDPGEAHGHPGRFLVRLYADRPVAIETVGAGCVGNVVIGVSLSTGWNVAASTFDAVRARGGLLLTVRCRRRLAPQRERCLG